MKALHVSLTLVAGALLSSAGNVLENPTFCSDKAGRMSGWRVEAREHHIVEGRGPEGATVLQLPLKNGRAYVVQTGLSLEAGKSCRFGTWVRAQGLQKNRRG